MAKTVQCELCPNGCVLENGQHSRCRARMNKEGTLYSLVYGKPCAVHVDPIEKKPFNHFLQGSTAFSIATAGCVLSCKFCQNWQISQAKPEDTDTVDLPPDSVVRQAILYGCKSVTYTYTEPTVFYEYMYDTAVIAKKYGVKNTMHSCGYINEKPLRKLAKYLDAADIDLKAFTDDFYNRICNGSLKPVLNSLVVLKQEGVWLEITNLVIRKLIIQDLTLLPLMSIFHRRPRFPRKTGLFPAILTLRDEEICGSRVSRVWAREVAGLGRGIRRSGPKGVWSHVGGTLDIGPGSSPTKLGRDPLMVDK